MLYGYVSEIEVARGREGREDAPSSATPALANGGFGVRRGRGPVSLPCASWGHTPAPERALVPASGGTTGTLVAPADISGSDGHRRWPPGGRSARWSLQRWIFNCSANFEFSTPPKAPLRRSRRPVCPAEGAGGGSWRRPRRALPCDARVPALQPEAGARGGSPTRTASGAHVALWSRPVVFLCSEAPGLCSPHIFRVCFLFWFRIWPVSCIRSRTRFKMPLFSNLP